MAIIIFVCIIILSIIISFQLVGRKLQKKIGGKKKYHPVGGTVFHQLINLDKLHDYMTHLASKYNTYRMIGPFRTKIYTSHPANVEHMLKTNFHNYAKGWFNYNILKDLFGDGIFTVDGDKWRHQRKVASYEFSTRVLRDFSSVVFRKNVAKLANIVSQAATLNQPMDIQELLMKSSLDSIFRVAFGVDLDTMCGSYEEGARFGNAFNEASAMTLRRYVDVTWKIKKALNIGSEAKLKKNIKVVDEFVYKLISAKMHKSSLPQDPIELKKDDILSRFVEIKETDPKYLRDIILNFIIAGKDTTATALSWFIYMVCKHPHVQDKLAQEIKHATGYCNVDISEFGACLNEDALREMHYLHAALSETLRLYPPVPVDPKICVSDDTMPDGFSVKKGDVVFYHPYAMGRLRCIWGEDALDFKPERWIDDKGCFRAESPFKFTAFQAGPRTCLGREFAYTQMKIFSAFLLRFFVFKLSDENHTPSYRTMITLHIQGGLIVRAFPR